MLETFLRYQIFTFCVGGKFSILWFLFFEKSSGHPNSSACPFGDWSDWGNCVYQSSCCQTILVNLNTQWTLDEDTVDGFYTRIYIGEDPTVIYKKVVEAKVPNTNPPDYEDRYIHFDAIEGFWVVSSDYWNQGQAEPNYKKYFRSTTADLGVACPSDITKWESTQVRI